MGIAKLYGQKASGTNINGIIKDYHAYAGENISAGDLVEYINGIASKVDYGTSKDTAIDTAEYSGREISAVELDNNRVFIAFAPDSTYYLHSIVVTIQGANIILGTKTQLSTKKYSGGMISAVLVEKNKVFIAHSSDSHTANTNYLNGMVCTISETTIMASSSVQISSGNISGFHALTELLPSGKIFIAHSYGSDYYLYGMLVTISGTTITAGTDTAINANSRTATNISTTLLPNEKVFIAHSYNTKKYLYSTAVTISGTTITAGTSTKLVEVDMASYTISTALLPNGKVLITHSYSSNYYLYAIMVTLNGATITPSTDTSLSTNKYSGYRISTLPVSNNKALIFHCDSATYILRGMICNINDTLIEVLTDIALNNNGSGYGISSILLKNGTIFTAHSHTENLHYLYAQIFAFDEVNNTPTNNIIITEYETQVRKTTTSKFDGVAKTSGVGGNETGHKDLVSIYTLDTNFITRDGNAIMTADKNTFITKQ